MDILYAVCGFLVAIMILVFIHEYGHYKVGRLCGVGVRKFSIGFGKPFLSWFDKHGTQWQIAPFPLGGFVMFYDSRNETLTPEEAPHDFNTKSVWARFAIVAAGPLANLIFAVIAFSALNLIGREEVKPMMGAVITGSIAQKGGFKDHDMVTAINGKSTILLSDVNLAIARGAVEKSTVVFDVKDSSEAARQVKIDFAGFDVGENSRDILKATGFMMPGVPQKPFIESIAPDSPAQKGGIRPNSVITKVNDTPVFFWSEVRTRIYESGVGKPVALELLDDKQQVYNVQVVPAKDDDGAPKIGITMKPDRSEELRKLWTVKVNPGFIGSVQMAIERCWDISVMSLKAIKGMIVGTDSPKGISGPVSIAEHAGKAAEMGITTFIAFMGFISLSLFLMNMLPVPALDGGHLVQYMVEMVIRKPVPLSVQIALGKVGMFLLFGLMFFAIFNDFARIFKF